MDIFESLESLNVSEECFNDIVGLVEGYINELEDDIKVNCVKKRIDNLVDATNAAKRSNETYPKRGTIEDKKKSLLQTAALVKEQGRMRDKLNRSTDLANKSIKDPAKRDEVVRYAKKIWVENLGK